MELPAALPHIPHVFFSRIDHRHSGYRRCECQQCSPTPLAMADVIIHGSDGLDSEGYSLDEPREWSAEEIANLRRREFACDDYGRDI